MHSDKMKLRILLRMVKADFLKAIKATISVELSRKPVTYTYAQALRAFKMEVLKLHPEGNLSSKSARRIKELKQKRKGGNQKGGGQVKKSRPDSQIITLLNGKKIEYHPSFRFPSDLFAQFRPERKKMLTGDRDAYKKRMSSDPTIQALQKRVDDLESTSVSVPAQVGDQGSVGLSTQISQVTQGTIMGGRNEQIRKKRK